MKTFSVVDINTLKTEKTGLTLAEAHAYVRYASDLTGHGYQVIEVS